MNVFTLAQNAIPISKTLLALEQVPVKIEIKPSKSKAKKEIKDKPMGDCGLILYADGSTRPNPGHGGWGLHGYLFELTEPKKGTGLSSNQLTDRGYLTDAKLKAFKENAEMTGDVNGKVPSVIKPLKYIDAYGCFHVPVTNNYSELQGMSYGLKYAGDQTIKNVTLYSDSQYVVEGANRMLAIWKENNWVKRDGTYVQHQAAWKELDQYRTDLYAKGVGVKIAWIKGHSIHLGNQLADKNSRLGSHKAQCGEAIVKICESESDGYWSSKYNKHPFLFHRSAYFSTRADTVQPGEYYLGEHGKDVDMLGKRSADGRHSAVILNTPDPLIEMARSKQISAAAGKEALIMMRLDQLFGAEASRDLLRFGDVCMLQRKTDRLDLYLIQSDQVKDDAIDNTTLPGAPLTRELNPPLLALRAIQAVNLLKGVLLAWKNKVQDKVETKGLLGKDVTSTFYAIDDKGNYTLKDEFIVGFTNFTELAPYQTEDGKVKEMPITVDMASDLPDRNTLKRLEKTKPTVSIVTWVESEHAFRFAYVIQSELDWGIWAATYSNLRLIKPTIKTK